MDQSIATVFDQCVALFANLKFLQQVRVPFTFEYHWSGRDQNVPEFIDTVNITGNGNLLFKPAHPFAVSGNTHFPQFLFVPASLSATISGAADAQGPGAGGGFTVPSIRIAINSFLPILNPDATVQIHSDTNVLIDMHGHVSPTAIPITATQTVVGGSTANATLHLGQPIVTLLFDWHRHVGK